MTHFIMNKLSLNKSQAYSLQKAYFRKHGTTMRGLIENHQIDPSEFLEYVHNVDLSLISRNNEPLNRALESLPGRKVIFTNASKIHSLNVTRHMGIDHHFDSIFDITDSNYIPKPDKLVYSNMVEQLEIKPQAAVMIEDMAKNLIPAYELGMTTVWLRSEIDWAIDCSQNGHIHYFIDDLINWFNDLGFA